MDPRTPLHEPEGRPARHVPWAFVWLGVLTLGVAGAVAWVVMHPGSVLPSNINAPAGNGNGDDSKKDRAVAIAYVDVEQGVTPLYPVRAGRVAEVFVKEGDDVEKDQPLVKVDDSLAQEQLAEAELALEGARVAKKQAQKLAAQQKDAERAQEKKIAIRKAEVAEAEATLEKAKNFYEGRVGGSKEDVRIAEAVVRKARAAVEAEEAELQRIKNMDVDVAVEAADVQIKAKQRQVAKAKLDLREYVLRSPGKGKILRSFVNVGEALGSNPQRPAMEFAPDGPRIVRAEIEQEFASHVRAGMKARIYDYDASNDHVWHGQVARLSDWISKRRSQVFEPMQFNDVRTLEAVIKLEDEPKYPLRIGQRVRVVLEW
jgi:multidrug resistance efflux pump